MIAQPFFDDLRALSEATAVSGDESEVRGMVLTRLRASTHVSEITTDPIGNVTALIRGTGSETGRLLLTAHMDEPGFMVTNIGEDGLISVSPVGPTERRILPTQRVVVGTEKAPGVILFAPIHHNQNQKLLDSDDIAIDVGASGKSGVPVSAGDRIGFSGAFSYLRESSPLVIGKSLDRSAACATLLTLIADLKDSPLPFDIAVAFTAQSYVGQGGRGAYVAGNRLKPTVSITLTAVIADDVPAPVDVEPLIPTVKLGGGPVIRLKEPSMTHTPALADWIEAVASEKGIPVQRHALAGRTDRSDAARIAESRSNPQTIAVGVPVRYLGTTRELLHLSDLERLYTLLGGLLAGYNTRT